MKSFLVFSVISLGLSAAACSAGDAACSELACDDGNPCTEDSCDASGAACANAMKADWAPCQFDGRRGACNSGACSELEWPVDLAEHERIQAQCGERPIEHCDEDARCAHLTAGRFDPTLVCLEPTSLVGCASAFRICGLSITTAQSPEGALYRFPDTCLPDGWEPANNDVRAIPVTSAGPCEFLLDQWPTDAAAQTIREECEALSGRQCGDRDDCRTIFPFRVDEDRICLEIWSGHEFCTSRFRMCDPTPTVARTPEEESFVLGNDCVLESWEITGSMDGPNSHVFSWPTCAVQP